MYRSTSRRLPLSSTNLLFSSSVPSSSSASSAVSSRSSFLLQRRGAAYSQSGGRDPNAPTNLFPRLALGVGLIAAPAAYWYWTRYEKRSLERPDTSGAPGEVMSLKTTALDAGANMIQRKDPINAIHAYLCGVHNYCGQPNRQVIAHHYCSHINEDVRQCLIYDSDQKNARLIGVEYVISPRLFEALDEEERKYWHSHAYEVKSGNLTAPGLPSAVEHKLMEDLAPTYGKTFHFWQIDVDDPLPLGPPKLMMAVSEDAPIRADVMEQRDKHLNISTAALRHEREDIPMPKVMAGADHWRTSKPLQLYLGEAKK